VETARAENLTSTVFYLPHQAAKKEKHRKTKWRKVSKRPLTKIIAFSKRGATDGTNHLPEIFAILLRFRLYPTAIVSDITQAFLQLALDEKDRLDHILLVQNHAG